MTGRKLWPFNLFCLAYNMYFCDGTAMMSIYKCVLVDHNIYLIFPCHLNGLPRNHICPLFLFLYILNFRYADILNYFLKTTITLQRASSFVTIVELGFSSRPSILTTVILFSNTTLLEAREQRCQCHKASSR